jgi:hypothetical protein
MWSRIYGGSNRPDRKDGKGQSQVVSACSVVACVRGAAVEIDQRQT